MRGYQAAFDDNLKSIFIEGLPDALVEKLTYLEFSTTDSEKILTAVQHVHRNKMWLNALNVSRYQNSYPALTPEQLAYRKANKPNEVILRQRTSLICDRCGLKVRHHACECFIPLDESGRPIWTQWQI